VVLQCKTGVWLKALGNGDQCCPMGRKAREELCVLRDVIYIVYRHLMAYELNNVF